MADSHIAIDEPTGGATDKRVDTESLTVSATTVQRQRIQVAGAADDDIAIVTHTTPGASDHGLVVRTVGTVTIQEGAAMDVSAATVTVTGTVTANLSATDNAVLDSIDTSNTAIQTAVQLIDDAVFTDDAGYTVASSKGMVMMGVQTADAVDANDAGAVAITTDRAMHVNVAKLGGTAITTGTGNADSGCQRIVLAADQTIEMSLATSAQSVIEATRDAVQIIDNIVYTEDSVHTTGDSGVMMFGVRQDSQADFGADGDYVPLSIDANGAVRVTGGGGGTEYTEDAAAPTNPVGGTIVMERDDALAGLTPVEGDWTHPYATAEGALWVQDFNSDAILADTANMDTNLATVAGAVSGSEMQVDIVSSATITVTGTTTANAGTGFPSVHTEDTAHNTGDTGLMPLAVRRDADTTLAGADGDYSPLQVNASGQLKVEVFDGGDTLPVGGTVAHDAADSGNPQKMGAKALSFGTNPTEVANNDRTDLYANVAGVLFTIGGHPNVTCTQLNVTDADGAQTNTAIVTTTEKIAVTHITVTCDDANTNATQIRIGFGTTTTPANDADDVVLSHPGIPSGSGVSVGDGSGIIGVGGAGEDLRVTCEDPVGGALDIVVTYFEIAT